MKNYLSDFTCILIFLLCFFSIQQAFASFTVTLTPSNYNGTNISCFGAQDGSITANPAGGTAPYTYTWSNQETTQTITDLAPGYYRVEVKDAVGAIVYAEITLTEPEALTVAAVPYTYNNGYNISCYSCSNGIIDVYADNGTPPYSYLWNDGNTNQNRMALAPGSYWVTVTDANGCTVNSEQPYLNGPDRDDWTMNGNSGSNSTTNFIGTTDNKDLVFKTNNTERLKLKSSGEVKISNLIGNGTFLVYADSNGVLSKPDPGGSTPVILPWMNQGNTNINASYHFIGTINNAPLIFKTNSSGGGGEYMRLTETGKLGIGISTPAEKLHVVGNAIFSNSSSAPYIGAFIKGNSTVSTPTTPDYSFGNDQSTGIFHPSNSPNILGFTVGGVEGMRVINDGHAKVVIGPSVPINTSGTYRLYVDDGILAKKVKVAIPGTIDWSDYALNKNYELMSLKEVDAYINNNHHLPGIPSAEEVVKTGIDLGEMDAKLLLKIEELTLYVIKLEKEVNELKTTNHEK